MKRALIIGASGFVGARLAQMLGARAVSTYRGRAIAGGVRFDASRERLASLLPQLPTDLSHVFVPYGAIDPEACARDPAGTAAINVVSIIAVLKDAADAGLTPVFFSTDYVFDGTRGGWAESDHPRPRTAYGAQKLAVEAWLGAVQSPWLIARFSKIVGADPSTHSVLGQWVEEIKAGKAQMLAADQIFSPTWIDDACGALIGLAERSADGIFHVANSEPMSRLALFELLLKHMRARDATLRVEITRAKLHDLPFFSEKRPLDTSLGTDKLQRVAPWRFRTMNDLCTEIARTAIA